jgi:hypothetical protein
VDGGRGRDIGAQVGQCGSVAIHGNLASAESRGLDTAVGAGSHNGTLGVVGDVPEMAVDTVSSLSGHASCGSQLKPSPISIRSRHKGQGQASNGQTRTVRNTGSTHTGERDEGEDKSTDSNHRVDRYRK